MRCSFLHLQMSALPPQPTLLPPHTHTRTHTLTLSLTHTSLSLTHTSTQSLQNFSCESCCSIDG
uniref:Uncharacterized protein n=1 Tax=Anguilla anguilla TaxID=7936 RepID=A0A0E9VXG7_ANGAN